MKRDFLSLIDKKHIKKFCNILKISVDKIKNIYVNPGRSANNSNFVFVVGEKTFLYRIPGLGTEKFSSRKKERLAYKSLSPFKITDEVIFLSAETGIKISKYYVDSKIPSHNNKKELAASMGTLRRLHGLEIYFPYVDTLFDRLKRYKNSALEAGGAKYYLDGFDDYLSEMKALKNNINSMYSEGIKFCFTHGDASINNILITKEYNYPILIDMEFPAFSDPFEDIATFCVDAEYRENNIIQMLEYYLGRKGTAKEEYRVLGLSVAAAMMWYSWAAYKCAVEKDKQLFINFRDDYHQYIQEMFISTKRAYKRI